MIINVRKIWPHIMISFFLITFLNHNIWIWDLKELKEIENNTKLMYVGVVLLFPTLFQRHSVLFFLPLFKYFNLRGPLHFQNSCGLWTLPLWYLFLMFITVHSSVSQNKDGGWKFWSRVSLEIIRRDQTSQVFVLVSKGVRNNWSHFL